VYASLPFEAATNFIQNVKNPGQPLDADALELHVPTFMSGMNLNHPDVWNCLVNARRGIKQSLLSQVAAAPARQV